MFRAIKCDLNKTIVNIGFVGAVFTVLLLCFTSTVYTDNLTGKAYTVIEALTSLDKSIIQTNENLSSYNVFSGGLSGYAKMFLPIIVAFPFMISYCSERNNGLMRFTITRTGKTRYYFSKFFTAITSGGLAVMIGLMLFGIVSFFLFPPISTYEIDSELIEIMGYNEVEVRIVKILINAFIFGAISTLPGFFISSFCKNPYLITCVPFLLVYIWNIALNKLETRYYLELDFEAMERIQCFYPNSLTMILFSEEFNTNVKITLAFNIGLILFCLLGYIIIMNRRVDKGV